MPLSQVSSCLSDPIVTVLGVLLPHLAEHTEKTVAARHRCIREHHAALEQAAAQQAPDQGSSPLRRPPTTPRAGPGWYGPASVMSRSRR